MSFINDSDEEQEEDEDMPKACILVSEQEEKERRPKFYVRERIAWEQHIAELTAEGDEAFQ